jgi:hypothetical protein
METKLIINADVIPPPFTFNPLKHHLGFIREMIENTETGLSTENFFHLINETGPQLTDIYYGGYSVAQILQSIKSQLTNLCSFEKAAYEAWVDNSGKHYNFLELPDHSKWIFRLGEKEGRYIHFHPARLSISLRVRGATLKTALALKIMAKESTTLYSNTDYINTVRRNVLNLSPIKDIKHFTAIKKILELLD